MADLFSTSRQVDIQPLKEAAAWYATLQGGATETDMRNWHAWLEQPGHRMAWSRMEAVARKFAPLHVGHQEPDVVLTAIQAGQKQDRVRRRMLRSLSWAPCIGLLGWLSWRETGLPQYVVAQFADYRTARGEIKSFLLEDGTRLWLNTASAVTQDCRPDLRRLLLVAGEILIQTGSDARPFVVDTEHGRLRAIGTRFIVRLHEGHTQLSVHEGAVEIRPARNGEARIVYAGEQTWFDPHHIASVTPAESRQASWVDRIYQTDGMSLGSLLQELERYHLAYFAVDDDVANLQVMGTFPMQNLQETLSLLKVALPIRVWQPLHWWVSIESAHAA